MNDGSKVPKSVCEYCRSAAEKHLECCPHDNPLAQMIWKDGYKAATEGQANAHADDPTYTLGFTSGEYAKAMKDGYVTREDHGEPPSRSSFPSLTELGLALGERHPAPPVPSAMRPPHPPGKEFEDAQIAAAESVIF
ncbi:hypothetical protein M0Q28_02010 [Patescibacteria group bacterium]|jgi:hypothetical protein|nr:hypothetical protein [Patescibacteria group bacterium]